MTERQGPIIEGVSRQLPRQSRVYRSSTDRAVAGVAGGLSERFGIDPGVIRLGWLAASVLSSGLALLPYALLTWALPQEPAERAALKITRQDSLWQRLKYSPVLFWGSVLGLSGLLWLLRVLGWLPWSLTGLLGEISDILTPLLLVSLGVYLVLLFTGHAPNWQRLSGKTGKLRSLGARLPLRRSRSDRQIAGVCGGIAHRLGIDPLVVRLAWAVLTAAGGVAPGVLLYALAALLIP